MNGASPLRYVCDPMTGCAGSCDFVQLPNGWWEPPAKCPHCGRSTTLKVAVSPLPFGAPPLAIGGEGNERVIPLLKGAPSVTRTPAAAPEKDPVSERITLRLQLLAAEDRARTLQGELEEMRELLRAYRDKRSCDGFNGRDWDAMRHYEAEQDVARMEASRAALSPHPDGT